MSGASLKLMQHTGPWRSVHYLALGGTDYAALDAFLKYSPAVRKIVLCLDNDNAGRTRTQDIIAHLAGSGKAVEDRPPPVGKDYNDTLVQYMQEYRAHCISMDRGDKAEALYVDAVGFKDVSRLLPELHDMEVERQKHPRYFQA